MLYAGASALALAGPVMAQDARSSRLQVTPYVEAQQLLYANLDGGGGDDVVTYTQLAAGVDAVIANRNAMGQLSYRYDRFIGWEDGQQDQSVHSGFARVSLVAVPDLLSFDAAGIATRARTSLRGASPEFFAGDTRNTTQVYALYAGPSFARSLDGIDVSAAYHIGYVHADTGQGGFDLGPGAPVLEDYSSAVSHRVDARIGMRPGALPFGWAVSGGLIREDARRLDARFDDRFVRGDVTVPVTYALALVGGIGYEEIEASQRQILTDAAGNALLDEDRRFQGDPNRPRVLVYDQDGMIWDVGVLWRPDRRTSLEARYGHRYGGEVWYGNFSHQLSETATVQAGVYNQLETFGLGLTAAVATLPTSFAGVNNPFTGALDGCVFGNGQGGACLDNPLQSVNGSLFRARGAWALWSGGRGPWSYGVGLAYAQRRYIATTFGNGLYSFDGVKDESVTAQANLGRQLSTSAALSGNLYATWYDSGLPGAPSVVTYGASGFYSKSFSNHLVGQAGAGLYSSEQEGVEDPIVGSLLVGLRYQF